ncbi:NAD-dependent epimerase/dehydratase family protein [Flavobacterium luteum]|uniref:NAD-dependent epimerase/dehydratase family protein n=1 Tax=Flavobacterium luteum TaxID=2026654 RepID=A0A7J5AGZ9_9FLAO|nr:NAD-dependent epimerase/dehydratase family protein [Flavobacterium luteum]KAB1156815.1 NAD-dependent epimerase/dehydratase family protein [Flavobacterium luteum]
MVLITGATGLVGSHLAIHLLENNEKVRAIYRTSTSIEKTKSLFALYKKEFLFEKMEWIQADITDIPSLEIAFIDVEYVYHCAALISFDPKDEKQLRKINIEGTANIVNFCSAYAIKKLCYVSSIAALGDLKENETTITEETEWNPEKSHSDYAISKYGAEIEVWRGYQEGLPIVIVSPGVILGPGFWNTGSGQIFSKVKKGLLLYTKGITGFVTVNDVVKIMTQLMKSDISGERYVAIAANISFETILNTISKALKVKPPRIYAKPWITEIIWRIDWITSTFFNRKRRLSKDMAHSLHSENCISNEKVKRDLEFAFQNVEVYCNEMIAFSK